MTAPAPARAEAAPRELLRFLTCGSVDDGKSTLIGRLLFDSKGLYDDHVKKLESDSKRVGSAGDGIDYALLTDGLKAEREQGITIDVAYRYFSTPRRKFIIADTPGHEQYTRNMATGASTADLAVILVDARQGVLSQTRRHSFIAALLGVRRLVVAVNKMDLVAWDQEVFEAIRREFTNFAARLEVRDVHFIPLSALEGDNVVTESERMPWYRGGPLLDYLETAHIASDRNLIDLRLPVQYVLRQSGDFRGYCGTVASGVLRPGDEVMILPSRVRTRVKALHSYDGPVEEAFPPSAVTVELADQVDASRGDWIVHPRNLPEVSTNLEAMVVWMDEGAALEPGREFLMKQACRTTRVTVESLRYRINVNSLHREPSEQLALNEIGRLRLRAHRPVAYDAYTRNRATGAFVLIDPVTNGTVAAGMALRRRSEEDAAAETEGGVRWIWVRGGDAALGARVAGLLGGRRARVLDDGLLGSLLGERSTDAGAVAALATAFLEIGVPVVLASEALGEGAASALEGAGGDETRLVALDADEVRGASDSDLAGALPG